MSIKERKTVKITIEKCENCKSKLDYDNDEDNNNFNEEQKCFVCGKKCCFKCSSWSSGWLSPIGKGVVCNSCQSIINQHDPDYKDDSPVRVSGESYYDFRERLNEIIVKETNKYFGVKIQKKNIHSMNIKINGGS